MAKIQKKRVTLHCTQNAKTVVKELCSEECSHVQQHFIKTSPLTYVTSDIRNFRKLLYLKLGVPRPSTITRAVWSASTCWNISPAQYRGHPSPGASLAEHV